MTKKLMEQVLDALITYRDFINNAHIIEGQFHWLEGTGDAIKALEEALAKQKPVNQFNPDWDAMAVMVEEQQRMAKRIEELEAELEGEPVSKKWIMRGHTWGIAKFDAEGLPLFYDRESFLKFKNGELSEPCKGKNCGSLNGWLHSAECHAEHEAHYTTPEQEQDEPVAYGFPNSAITGNQKWMLLEEKIPENDQYKGALWIPLYTTPQQRKPLTDDEFLELLLRKGNSELLHYTTFVGGSIQMQGKIGLLKSVKVIKEFIEEYYGIKE